MSVKTAISAPVLRGLRMPISPQMALCTPAFIGVTPSVIFVKPLLVSCGITVPLPQSNERLLAPVTCLIVMAAVFIDTVAIVLVCPILKPVMLVGEVPMCVSVHI